MKDSTWAVPFYDYDNDDIDAANKKQKCYKESFEEEGSLRSVVKKKDKDLKFIHTEKSAFAFLKRCNCCLDHQYSKPIKYELWDDPKWGPGSSKIKECKCDCRHLMRWLCRGNNLETL